MSRVQQEPVIKPPIEVMPKRIWQQNRLQDLRLAIKRYKEGGFDVPPEWFQEAYELTEELVK